jgi:hypothetical protein
VTEKVQHDIDVLISAENDPARRAVLIVLQSINRSLEANTIATQQTQLSLGGLRTDFGTHLKNFETHTINEELLMSRGKGAWWVMTFVLGIVQAIAVYGWVASRNEIEEMKATATASQILHEKLLGKITHLEQTK